MRRIKYIAAALLAASALTLSACSDADLAVRDEYGRFGTQNRWVYSAAEDPDADAIWAQMTACTAALEESLSVSAEGGDIARFNAAAAGQTVSVGETAYKVLQTAMAISEETDGAYDPATGLLVDLWGFSPRHRAVDYQPALPYDRQNFEESLPEQKFINAFSAPEMTDFSAVVLSETDGGYSIAKPAAVASVDGTDYSMRISLDGIGKGASVDAAAEILRTAGVKYGYYNAGGSSLLVLENPARSDGLWEITVNSPREELGASYATLSVSNTTISTSGDYEQYYEIGGTRYCHIIGHDGMPVGAGRHVLCATVVGGSAAAGDARATALVAMTEKEAVAYASAHADAFRVMFVWYDAAEDSYALYTNLDEASYELTASFDRVEVFS